MKMTDAFLKLFLPTIICCAIIAVTAIFLFKQTVVEETVIVGFSWKWYVQEQELQTVQEEVLLRDIPLGSTVIEYGEMVCGSTIVKSTMLHTYCRSALVEYEKWVDTFRYPSSGDNRSPYWAEPITSENERVIGGPAYYWIHVRDNDGQTHRIEVYRSDWDQFQEGQTVFVDFTFVGKPIGLHKQ